MRNLLQKVQKQHFWGLCTLIPLLFHGAPALALQVGQLVASESDFCLATFTSSETDNTDASGNFSVSVLWQSDGSEHFLFTLTVDGVEVDREDRHSTGLGYFTHVLHVDPQKTETFNIVGRVRINPHGGSEDCLGIGSTSLTLYNPNPEPAHISLNAPSPVTRTSISSQITGRVVGANTGHAPICCLPIDLTVEYPLSGIPPWTTEVDLDDTGRFSALFPIHLLDPLGTYQVTATFGGLAFTIEAGSASTSFQLVALLSPAPITIGTISPAPGATVVLPYFEVDLTDPNGVTTLISVGNASATPAIGHVTLITDQSIPTLDFDIYLTGYDVQTINLRDIFNGLLPVTADLGADPIDQISPQGRLSMDLDFPGSSGPCGSASTVYRNPALSAALIDHVRKSHTGQLSPLYGGCSGASYGDNIARGYLTVDAVVQCNLSFPSDAGYFTALAANQNVLWGDFFLVDPRQSSAVGESLLHLEACGPGAGSTGRCPLSFAAGDYSFYGRYNAVSGQDQREPLATTFASRFITGGGFDGGTDLIVWRDSKTRPAGANGPHSCSGVPSWYPLNQSDVVAFDEQENPTDLCFRGDNVSPPTGGTDSCFPLETQRVHVGGGNTIAADLIPPADHGWLFLNLNHTLASGDPYPGRAQAWVIPLMKAADRYQVGFSAVALDNALSGGPGIVLIP